jgi:hypothetical protein
VEAGHRVLVHEVKGWGRDLSEIRILRHDAGVALHYWPSRDMQIPEDLVGSPPANELDGGLVHLAKKEGHGTAGP